MRIYDPVHRNTIILRGKFTNCLLNILHNRYRIIGCNNIVTIENGTKLNKGLFLIIGSHNAFHIGKNCDFVNFIMRADGDGNKIIVGNDVILGGGVISAINAIDRTRIKIGNRCMFSYGIDIMSSDGHPIFIKGKREKYNKSKNINIGNHVWIGMHTQILKGVTIPNNCVIGAGSLVNKPFNENNCIIVGHPARIIKRDIDWRR